MTIKELINILNKYDSANIVNIIFNDDGVDVNIGTIDKVESEDWFGGNKLVCLYCGKDD